MQVSRRQKMQKQIKETYKAAKMTDMQNITQVAIEGTSATGHAMAVSRA